MKWVRVWEHGEKIDNEIECFHDSLNRIHYTLEIINNRIEQSHSLGYAEGLRKAVEEVEGLSLATMSDAYEFRCYLIDKLEALIKECK